MSQGYTNVCTKQKYDFDCGPKFKNIDILALTAFFVICIIFIFIFLSINIADLNKYFTRNIFDTEIALDQITCLRTADAEWDKTNNTCSCISGFDLNTRTCNSVVYKNFINTKIVEEMLPSNFVIIDKEYTDCKEECEKDEECIGYYINSNCKIIKKYIEDDLEINYKNITLKDNNDYYVRFKTSISENIILKNTLIIYDNSNKVYKNVKLLLNSDSIILKFEPKLITCNGPKNSYIIFYNNPILDDMVNKILKGIKYDGIILYNTGEQNNYTTDVFLDKTYKELYVRFINKD